jgi:hypothetical protein
MLKIKEDDWGTIQFARREKTRRREREKQRRRRARLAMQAKEPAPPQIIHRTQRVFKTSSGILAVRGQTVNRNTLGSAAIRESTAYLDVSLPYLEFLHGPISA